MITEVLMKKLLIKYFLVQIIKYYLKFDLQGEEEILFLDHYGQIKLIL
jgi:hypothetical protein